MCPLMLLEGRQPWQISLVCGSVVQCSSKSERLLIQYNLNYDSRAYIVMVYKLLFKFSWFSRLAMNDMIILLLYYHLYKESNNKKLGERQHVGV